MSSDDSNDLEETLQNRDPALAQTAPNPAVAGPAQADPLATLDEDVEPVDPVRDTRDLNPVSVDSYDMGATQALPSVFGPASDGAEVEVDTNAGAPPSPPPATGIDSGWDDSKLDEEWGAPLPAASPTGAPSAEVAAAEPSYEAAQVAELPDELLGAAAAAEDAPPRTPEPPAAPAAGPGPVPPAAEPVALTTTGIDPQEISRGKSMALVAHAGNLLGIPTFLIPLVIRDNEFSIFHAKQAAAGLALFWLISVVSGILGSLTCVGAILFVLCPLPGVIGIVWAASGKESRFPVLGEIAESILDGVKKK